MINKTVTNNQLLCYLSMLLLIFLSSSYYVTCDIASSTFTILLWVVLLFIPIIDGAKIRIDKCLIVFSVIIIAYVLSTIVNSIDVIVQFKIIYAIIVCFVIFNAYKYSQLKAVFVNILFWISLISIPMFIICLTNSSFLSQFVVRGANNRQYINLFIYGYMINSNRNGAIFWEPGAFASFINLSLAILMFDPKLKIRKRKIKTITLLIALISTFSTAGYLTFAVLILAFTFNKRINIRTRIVLGLAILLLIVVGINIFYDEIFIDDGGVFGKIRFFFEHQDMYSNGQATSSVSVRLYSILKPLEIFSHNILFGVGNANLQKMTIDYTKGAITCTFVNWFAINGLLYGLLMVFGYFRLVWNTNNPIITKIMLLIFLMCLIASQDFAQNPFFIMLTFFGYKDMSYKKSFLYNKKIDCTVKS